MAVLIEEHLGARFPDLGSLATATGVSRERLTALQEGAVPGTDEVRRLAEALDVYPVHLFRPSPSVLARRVDTLSVATGTEFAVMLDEIDSYLAAYAADVRPEIDFQAPARTLAAARKTGEGWGTRHRVRNFAVDSEDPLLETVEAVLSIPVFIWPVASGPAGATIDFEGVMGIWVNSHHQPGSRQRFTLAHELAHILLRHLDAKGGLIVDQGSDLRRVAGTTQSEKREAMANACAAGVLCDEETLRDLWGDAAPSAAAIARVAARVGISYIAAWHALRHHRFLDQVRHANLADAAVGKAFEVAGVSDVYRLFESQRNRRRLSPYLPNVEYLERALERSLL